MKKLSYTDKQLFYQEMSILCNRTNGLRKPLLFPIILQIDKFDILIISESLLRQTQFHQSELMIIGYLVIRESKIGRVGNLSHGSQKF